MPRYRLLLEYDGGPYNGFQAQADQPSVQGSLERAVKAFCGETIRIAAAGRTDSGVHATGQVAHVDLERAWPAQTVRNALNAHLRPEPICVLEAAEAPEGWHARFSASERRYLFRILNRRPPPGLDQGRVWHVAAPLDAPAMHAAAKALTGLHDFTTFRDVHCQSKSPVKTLDVARVERFGEEVRLVFEARSFLHRQVRSMTGTLVEVGAGRWPGEAVAAALAAVDRTACGPVAPPQGLYLTGVGYEGVGF
jgi:tRNA pseudouridine38-40 synthase